MAPPLTYSSFPRRRESIILSILYIDVNARYLSSHIPCIMMRLCGT